jgi:P pilus assembly chaperone PapD
MRLATSFMTAIAAAGLIAGASPARADLVLSELIVDLQPGKLTRDDLEVWNNSPDRAFVAVEPREIVNPALPSQTARQDPDPEKLGILVTPARIILEPGQRRLIRIADVAASPDREHVYRVTVKPVVGGITSSESGLKILVGYDVLVLVRPAQALTNVVAMRKGRTLTFDNKGNVSVEVIDGRQCGPDRKTCSALPGKRLYAGASWTVDLLSDGPAEYTLKSPGRADRKVF